MLRQAYNMLETWKTSLKISLKISDFLFQLFRCIYLQHLLNLHLQQIGQQANWDYNTKLFLFSFLALNQRIGEVSVAGDVINSL